MTSAKGHRWFAAMYDRMTASAERSYLGAARAETAGGAKGRVLEIGAGTGANFRHYTELAEQVVATEPDPYMLRKARVRAQDAARPIELHQAPADDLPFEDGASDTVVSTVVLCTVPDPLKALGEIRRVLRPGGELRFYGHVRSDNAVAGLFQDVALPLWRWIGAGCHCNRDTASNIRAAGFEIRKLAASAPFPPIPPMVLARPHIQGVAISI